MNRRRWQTRNGHATPIVQGGKCPKINEQFTSSTSCNTFKSNLWHYGNYEYDGLCLWNLWVATPFNRSIARTSRMWKRWNCEGNLSNSTSETELLNKCHQANLNQWKETLDLRCSYQDPQFSFASHEHQWQAREAHNQAVKESSENYYVMMMQRFQRFQNRHDGRLGEHKRRVAQMIGSEAPMLYVAKEATCCMNIKFFFIWEKKKKSSWKSRRSQSYSHTMWVIEKPYMIDSFNKNTLHNAWKSRKHNGESSCRLRSSWCCPHRQCERQAVIIAQQNS